MTGLQERKGIFDYISKYNIANKLNIGNAHLLTLECTDEAHENFAPKVEEVIL